MNRIRTLFFAVAICFLAGLAHADIDLIKTPQESFLHVLLPSNANKLGDLNLAAWKEQCLKINTELAVVYESIRRIVGTGLDSLMHKELAVPITVPSNGSSLDANNELAWEEQGRKINRAISMVFEIVRRLPNAGGNRENPVPITMPSNAARLDEASRVAWQEACQRINAAIGFMYEAIRRM